MDVQGVSLFTNSSKVVQGVTLSSASSMDVQGLYISTSMKNRHAGFTPFHCKSMNLQGVSISTACSMNMQGVSISTASGMDVQGVPISTTSSVNVQGVSHFTPAVWTCRVYVFIAAGMPDCPASGQSGTGMNNNADAGNNPVPGQREIPVPDWDTGCWNADAFSTGLDADA